MANSTPGIELTATTPEPRALYSESRTSYLTRTGVGTPRFLQGVFPFAGRGVHETVPLDDILDYTVPAGRVAEIIYFRAGNFSEDIIYLTVSVDGTPSRYFPVGPKADVHVPLAIVEQHGQGKRLQIGIGAPRGLAGSVVLDIGMLELPAGAE